MSVLGAILPAILISVVAARVAISRYACVAVIVCKMLGGAVSVNRFVVTCQPVAYFYHLSERRDGRKIQFFPELCRWQSSNIAVAGIVFIASILVPFTKVIVMFTLLLSIHFKCQKVYAHAFCYCGW